MPPVSISPAVLDNLLHQNYPEVVELGFVRQNLTSIVDSTRNQSAFEKAAQAISENSELIKSLKSSVGFTIKNLSSVLSKSREHCALAIQKLHSNSSVLLELVAPDKFSASNLSSILSGSGARVEQAIVALAANKDALLELVAPDKFSASNLSSMLNGSGARVEQAIKALSKNRALLIGLITQGKFTATELAALVTRTAAKVGQAIQTRIDSQAAGSVHVPAVVHGQADIQASQDEGVQDDHDYFQYVDDEDYQTFFSTTLLGLVDAAELEGPLAKRPRFA